MNRDTYLCHGVKRAIVIPLIKYLHNDHAQQEFFLDDLFSRNSIHTLYMSMAHLLLTKTVLISQAVLRCKTVTNGKVNLASPRPIYFIGPH